MHRSTDSGFIIPPVGGGIGYFERHAPTRPAGRVSLWRSLMRRIAAMIF